MKLLYSLLQRQIVQLHSSQAKQINLDFTVEALKCHKDDQHKVRGLETEVEVPPFACNFHKSLLRGHMLAVADEDGSVRLFDLRKQGSSSKLKGWVAHSNAIFDIAWIHDEPKLVTASGDQTAQLWDIQHSKQLAVFRGHSCSLKSVNFQEQNHFVFATGARDGNVMIWDVRCNKRDGYYQPVNTIHNCHSTPPSGAPQRTNKKRGRRSSATVSQDSQQSVTSVQFQDENMIISAGAVDGNIKVWDLRKNYSNICTEPVPCHVFPYPGSGSRKHGFSSLAMDSNKSKLFANCTNNVIYMYDIISFQKSPIASFYGHSNTTFYVKSAVSPDDQFLMSGSGDCDAYIWKINKPKAAPFHLTGHVGEVTSVAWCPKDQGKVVTCSDDNCLNVWRVMFGEKDKDDFVGWCKRKPCLQYETTGNVHGKIKTPNTSPTRSQNSSASSSPLSLSPNPAKCCSPQQFLHSWLKSNSYDTNRNSDDDISSSGNNNNKRPRENDNIVNGNKRYCFEDKMKANRDPVLFSVINKKVTQNSFPSTSVSAARNSKMYPNENLKETSLKPQEKVHSEADKENIQINKETVAKCRMLNCHKLFYPGLEKGNHMTGSNTNTDITKFSQMSVVERDEQNFTNKDHKPNDRSLNLHHQTKMNSKTRNDMLLKSSTIGHGSKKAKTQNQPSSPLVPEPCSPDKEFGAVLKSMRCIKAYFKPVPEHDEDSPSKYCER